MDQINQHQNLKMKINSNLFNTAIEQLISIDYKCDFEPNTTGQFLYLHCYRVVSVDYSNSDDASLNSPVTAEQYFKNCNYKEITFDDLLDLKRQFEKEKHTQLIRLIKQERPLFEENYLKNGGKLNFLKWEEFSESNDGTGNYHPNWEEINSTDSDSSYSTYELTEHAKLVTSCLRAWVECAKTKAIPKGYFLMPIQPSKEMLENAELEFKDLNIKDIEDRIVFSHQAMIEVLKKTV